MDRIVRIGKCTVVCQNVPENWTEEETRHYAWMQLVNMNIKKAKKEIEERKFRHAE